MNPINEPLDDPLHDPITPPRTPPRPAPLGLGLGVPLLYTDHTPSLCSSSSSSCSTRHQRVSRWSSSPGSTTTTSSSPNSPPLVPLARSFDSRHQHDDDGEEVAMETSAEGGMDEYDAHRELPSYAYALAHPAFALLPSLPLLPSSNSSNRSSISSGLRGSALPAPSSGTKPSSSSASSDLDFACCPPSARPAQGMFTPPSSPRALVDPSFLDGNRREHTAIDGVSGDRKRKAVAEARHDAQGRGQGQKKMPKLGSRRRKMVELKTSPALTCMNVFTRSAILEADYDCARRGEGGEMKSLVEGFARSTALESRAVFPDLDLSAPSEAGDDDESARMQDVMLVVSDLPKEGCDYPPTPRSMLLGALPFPTSDASSPLLCDDDTAIKRDVVRRLGLGGVGLGIQDLRVFRDASPGCAMMDKAGARAGKTTVVIHTA